MAYNGNNGYGYVATITLQWKSRDATQLESKELNTLTPSYNNFLSLAIS